MHLLCTLVNVASINDPGTSASPTASRAIVSRASSTAAAAGGTRDVQRAATAAAADAVRSRPYLCGYGLGLVAWWGTDDMFQVHACKCFLVCRSWNDADGAVHPGDTMMSRMVQGHHMNLASLLSLSTFQLSRPQATLSA